MRAKDGAVDDQGPGSELKNGCFDELRRAAAAPVNLHHRLRASWSAVFGCIYEGAESQQDHVIGHLQGAVHTLLPVLLLLLLFIVIAETQPLI